jgi:hypothetical protein
MKCKKCGKSFKDIKAIGAHYRKAHPGAMKSRKPRRNVKLMGANPDQYASKLMMDHIRMFHSED